MSPDNLVQSVGRALDILELVVNSDKGMRQSSVVYRTNLKNTTAHNLLQTLVAKGFLVKRRKPILYCPGPVLVNYRRSQRDYDLFQRARPVMMSLTRSLGGNTRLCESVGMCMLSMLAISPGQLAVMQPHLPQPMLPYGIASAFQAFWDKNQQTIYEKKCSFAKYGKKTWKTRDKFKRFLADFRKNRVAMIPVRLCGKHFRVATPIFGPLGDVLAIICFIKPIKETTATFRRMCCEVVRKAGVELSSNG